MRIVDRASEKAAFPRLQSCPPACSAVANPSREINASGLADTLERSVRSETRSVVSAGSTAIPSLSGVESSPSFRRRRRRRQRTKKRPAASANARTAATEPAIAARSSPLGLRRAVARGRTTAAGDRSRAALTGVSAADAEMAGGVQSAPLFQRGPVPFRGNRRVADAGGLAKVGVAAHNGDGKTPRATPPRGGPRGMRYRGRRPFGRGRL